VEKKYDTGPNSSLMSQNIKLHSLKNGLNATVLLVLEERHILNHSPPYPPWVKPDTSYAFGPLHLLKDITSGSSDAGLLALTFFFSTLSLLKLDFLLSLPPRGSVARVAVFYFYFYFYFTQD